MNTDITIKDKTIITLNHLVYYHWEPDDDPLHFNVSDFCRFHKISRQFYYRVIAPVFQKSIKSGPMNTRHFQFHFQNHSTIEGILSTRKDSGTKTSRRIVITSHSNSSIPFQSNCRHPDPDSQQPTARESQEQNCCPVWGGIRRGFSWRLLLLRRRPPALQRRLHPPQPSPFSFPSASPGKPRQGESQQPNSQAFPFFVPQKKGNRFLFPYPFFFLRPVPPCITINSWHFWLAQ